MYKHGNHILYSILTIPHNMHNKNNGLTIDYGCCLRRKNYAI